MKKLFIGLLALTSVSAFSGSITNKKTGEYLELFIDKESRKVDILSTAYDLPNKTIELKKIKKAPEYTLNVILPFALTGVVCDALWYEEQAVDNDVLAPCLLIPVVNIPGVAALAIDVAVLPVTLTALGVQSLRLLIKNKQLKKDFAILSIAIQRDEHTSVSSKRFNRIKELLKIAR